MKELGLPLLVIAALIGLLAWYGNATRHRCLDHGYTFLGGRDLVCARALPDGTVVRVHPWY